MRACFNRTMVVIIGSFVLSFLVFSSVYAQDASNENSQSYSDNDWFVDDPFNEWDPMAEMQAMRSIMNRMFRRGFDHWRRNAGLPDFSASEDSFMPRIDVREQEEAYIIELDLPGMQKDNINVTLKEGALIVQGERVIEEEQKNEDADGAKTFIRRERRYGSFQRVIPLPNDAKTDSIQAEYKDGVLRITIDRQEQVSVVDEGQKIKVI